MGDLTTYNRNRQKDSTEGEGCANATEIDASWRCNSLMAGYNETRGLTRAHPHWLSAYPSLCSALTPCVCSIWLLFMFFWLSFLVACSLPTRLFPPSTHSQESRAPGTPVLQTRFLPLILPRLPMWVVCLTSGICKFGPHKDSPACVPASDECLCTTFWFWGHC